MERAWLTGYCTRVLVIKLPPPIVRALEVLPCPRASVPHEAAHGHCTLCVAGSRTQSPSNFSPSSSFPQCPLPSTKTTPRRPRPGQVRKTKTALDLDSFQPLHVHSSQARPHPLLGLGQKGCLSVQISDSSVP